MNISDKSYFTLFPSKKKQFFCKKGYCSVLSPQAAKKDRHSTGMAVAGKWLIDGNEFAGLDFGLVLFLSDGKL